MKPRNHTASCDPTEPDRSLAGVAGDERCEGMKYMTQTKGKASSSPWQKDRMMGKPAEGGGTGVHHRSGGALEGVVNRVSVSGATENKKVKGQTLWMG